MLSALINVSYCYEYVANQIPLELLLYTHVPTAALALLFGGYVFLKDRRLQSATLAVVCAAFAAWCLLDLSAWFVFLGSSIVMFAWSLLDLVALTFFLAAYHFAYAFIAGRDLPIWQKLAGLALLLPTVVWTALGKTLTAYDANTCEALEHPVLTLYPYFVEALILAAIVALAVRAYRAATEASRKSEIALAATGVFLFLGFFFASTLSVNVLVNETAVAFAYNFEIYGLFGMPVLLACLGYLVVRYQAFNLKVIGTQALVLALLALIASEFAFVTSSTNRALVAVTLSLTAFTGILLVRGVRREIAQREKIEGLAKELTTSNEQLSEFMSLATHEIRGPATFIKSVAANAFDGDLGEVSPAVRDAFQKVYVRANDILTLGGQYLDKSKLELNQLSYSFTKFDLAQLVADLVREFTPVAEQRGITLTTEAGPSCLVDADQGKLKEVIGNLIDNAIKYTPKGLVRLSIACEPQVASVTVADTGVGIPAATIPHLFQKFARADAAKVNLLGTGLGLYLARVFVEAHGGRLRVQSDGKGRGSTFSVELPRTRKPQSRNASSRQR